jgi:hypothetical protein
LVLSCANIVKAMHIRVLLRTYKDIPRDFQIFAWHTRQDVRDYTYLNYL